MSHLIEKLVSAIKECWDTNRAAAKALDDANVSVTLVVTSGTKSYTVPIEPSIHQYVDNLLYKNKEAIRATGYAKLFGEDEDDE